MNKSNTERKSRVLTKSGGYTALGQDIHDDLANELFGVVHLRRETSKSVTKAEFLYILENVVYELISG